MVDANASVPATPQKQEVTLQAEPIEVPVEVFEV
jgi:hypothetical protein